MRYPPFIAYPVVAATAIYALASPSTGSGRLAATVVIGLVVIVAYACWQAARDSHVSSDDGKRQE
ncbi:MAG: hypothetical protein MJE77_30550 [Proteobacteria bacterium]|nr:hypothetical protein [Pseudomonadota bacterium]